MDTMRHRMGFVPCALGAWICFVGCGAGEPEAVPEASGEVAPEDAGGQADVGVDLKETGGVGADSEAALPTYAVTYHRDIRPLMDRECVGCHGAEGTIAFSLEYDEEHWEEGPPPWAVMASNAVAAQRMPPWTPDLACGDLLHERALTDAELERFAGWTVDGFPEGDPADYAPPLAAADADWGLPSRVLGPAGVYMPDPTQADDYRCFVLEGEFEEDAYVVGDETLPGELSVVHHVIVYVVEEPEAIAKMASLSLESPELGYSCFGGTEVGGRLIAGWVPGMQPVETPEGSARKIPAGARLVMQVHYNTVSADPLDLPEDHTRLALWTLPAGVVPDQLVRFEAFANKDLHVPAGQVGVTQVQVDVLQFEGTVIGSVPHMHMFGRSIKAQVIREGEVGCMVDIPEWDFNWQQMYFFPPSQWVQVSPGDAHRLTCVYDNDQEAQPWIGGEQGEPADIGWGDGTFDEMCLNFLIVMAPAEDEVAVEPPPPAEPDTCNYIMDCYGDCVEGDALCFLGCIGGSPEGCVDCGVDAIVACSQDTCGLELGTMKMCLDECADGVVLCAAGPCFEQYEALYACSEPLLLAGLCDAHFEPCEFAYLEE